MSGAFRLPSLCFKPAKPVAGAALAIALLALAPVTRTAAFGSPSGRSVRCTVRAHSIPGITGSRVLSTHGEVIIYRTRGRVFDTLWACTRGQGRGAAIGRDESYQAREDEYGPEMTLGPVRVAGNWVMATQEQGSAQEAACLKYMGPCPGHSDTLVIGDATTGLTARPAHIVTAQLDGEGNVQQTLSFTRALLSPAGAAAWLEESRSGTATSTRLFACLASTVGRRMTCAARELAEGQIDSRSLQLAQTTVSWTQAGQPHSASIR
jgi:hypothetical protein